MNIKNKHRTLQKKIQSIERSMASFVLFRTLVKNKRAASAVISNLILIGAVLAIGLVALAYARSTSINYQTDYAKTMSTDIAKLKETLTFEYAHYNSNQLTMYVMNSGPVNVTIKNISISINSSPVVSYDLVMFRMSDNQQILNSIIAKGTEVKIILTATGLNHNIEYNVKITSGSDSNFAYNFLA